MVAVTITTSEFVVATETMQLKRLKYLLYGSLQKKFTDLISAIAVVQEELIVVYRDKGIQVNPRVKLYLRFIMHWVWK